ncbi:MAG: hydrogenase maturation nickel metallochaperone HypA [Thermoplasmata archaeon]
MHEFSAMQSIVNTILSKLKEYRVKAVEKVILEIGKLTFLGSEQLKFAFEVLTKDTMLEGAALEILEIEPVVKCEKCGYTGALQYENADIYHVMLPVFRCPSCGGKVEVVRGRECAIKSINMELEED